MAKNITILEGRETRTFGNVEKLQTNLVGGGTQNWIPEDEASEYVETETLEVTENGYYEPDSGTFYDGVDVQVEVEPELEEITITENGIYTPSGDGFSQVSVEVDASGTGDDPAVHGNEISAIAQTDINAGDTVAVQSNSNEPVSVSCPLEGIGDNAPIKYDGKYIYWAMNRGGTAGMEIRKKPVSKLDLSEYTVHEEKGSGFYDNTPWFSDFEGENIYSLQNLRSIFTAKKIPNLSVMVGFGKAIGVNNNNETSGVYDIRNKKVNDALPAVPFAYGCILLSSSRYITYSGMAKDWGVNMSFTLGLTGGEQQGFHCNFPSEIQIQGAQNYLYPFICGGNFCLILQDGADSTKKMVVAYNFDDEIHTGQLIELQGTIVHEFTCGNLVVQSDTNYDRHGIATDNGLIVINSDLEVQEIPNLTSVNAPYLFGGYVRLGNSTYKLTDPEDAIMVATSSKGASGVLGVAKSNVKAGEEGVAIILFS